MVVHHLQDPHSLAVQSTQRAVARADCYGKLALEDLLAVEEGADLLEARGCSLRGLSGGEDA